MAATGPTTTWGTRPELSLGHLLELLDLQRVPTDDDAPAEFRGRPQLHPADRVFGGLLLAQALVAAGMSAPEQHRPLALHAEFLQGVPTDEDLVWKVERIADGPSMTVRRTTLHAADGSARFTATSRWGTRREDLVSYSSLRPLETTPPEDLRDLEDRFGDAEVPVWWRMRRPVHFRHVQSPAYTAAVLPEQEHQSVWVRARGSVPADPAVQAAILAYVSDMSILEPVFRARRSARHAPGSRILSLSHFLTFHGSADLSQWHQLDARCNTVAQGRALGSGEFFDRDGAHLASINQLALVKVGE